MARIVKRAYKYRIYPTPEQAQVLTRTFGCVRFVYNKALEERIRAYRADNERLTYDATSKALTAWKKTPEFAFLKEVPAIPLQVALRNLERAYTNFFARRAGYPAFKSRKRSKATATYTRTAFRLRDGGLWLARMSGPLAVVWSRPLPEGAGPSSVTISRGADGRWFASFVVEETIPPLPQVDYAVGVDVGLTTLVTLSTGEKVANPRHERADRRKLTRAHKALTRKTVGSANRDKARFRLARAHARVADRRRDFLHKLSTRLVRENQAIAVEDLNIRGMVGNHPLARAVSDAAWRELRAMLEYKSAWYGRELLVVNRWFPSSKRCATCGDVRRDLPLDVREWACHCGAVHDRDVNAARNILAAGLVERRNACGADVRPQTRLLSGEAAGDETGKLTGDRGSPLPSRGGDEVKGVSSRRASRPAAPASRWPC